MRSRSLVAFFVALLAAVFAVAAPSSADPLAAPPTAPGKSGEHRVEVPPGADGTWGKHVTVKSKTAAAQQNSTAPQATVTALSQTGPTSDRLDVVIIGDGYTAGEQAQFDADARARWQQLSSVEPYASYRGMMNVWLVHAVSQDSGISRDTDTYPGEVNDKVTALGSYFWCSYTERLICTDPDAVKAYADQAPAVDIAVVVAHSSRYGGAGYYRGDGGLDTDSPIAGIATLSSSHPQSSLIGSHELGHSIGELGDEYSYCGPGYEVYCIYYPSWGENATPNLTIYGPDPQTLIDRKYKWYRWLGAADPSGGTVGMFEGGGYFEHGIWRPTQTSIMLTLGSTKFNLPSQEAMIGGFYRWGRLMRSDVPTGSSVPLGKPLTVQVAAVTGLAKPVVRWYVDGTEVLSARGQTTVQPVKLGVSTKGVHRISATVVDQTDAIRDPAIRTATSTTLSWSVTK